RVRAHRTHLRQHPLGQAVPLQVDDIQGIILYGYGHLRHACFLLLAISEASATRAWLETLDVLSGRFHREEIDRGLNIAFTSGGLKRLGLSDDLSAEFSTEFREGMAGTPHRQRILG